MLRMRLIGLLIASLILTACNTTPASIKHQQTWTLTYSISGGIAGQIRTTTFLHDGKRSKQINFKPAESLPDLTPSSLQQLQILVNNALKDVHTPIKSPKPSCYDCEQGLITLQVPGEKGLKFRQNDHLPSSFKKLLAFTRVHSPF